LRKDFEAIAVVSFPAALIFDLPLKIVFVISPLQIRWLLGNPPDESVVVLQKDIWWQGELHCHGFSRPCAQYREGM
jgi:hypothetical protein